MSGGGFVAGPVTRCAIAHGHRVVRALGATWRIRYVGGENVAGARGTSESGAILYAFPHGVLLPLAYAHRGRGVQVLISQSRDGEIIARITGKLGFGAVRGSSSRGGQRAVVEMAALGRQGIDVAVTPDGPRGPRGSVSPGAAVIASRAGLPIVPVGAGAGRAYRARSWDRFLVPHPLARVCVVYGSPLAVDAKDEGGLDGVSERLAIALAAVEEEAQAYASGVAVAPVVRREPA